VAGDPVAGGLVASDILPSDQKPAPAVAREAFVPPTITVIDPPQPGTENAASIRSSYQRSHRKVDVPKQQVEKRAGAFRWRRAILVLLTVVIAAAMAILARGDRLSRLLRKNTANDAAKVSLDSPLKQETDSPSLIETEGKDSPVAREENLAQSSDVNPSVAQERGGHKPHWRTHPIVRPQRLRARRPIYRAQARKFNQPSKRKLGNRLRARINNRRR
jgi:hypothetical protein